jgi:hypothetical protein
MKIEELGPPLGHGALWGQQVEDELDTGYHLEHRRQTSTPASDWPSDDSKACGSSDPAQTGHRSRPVSARSMRAAA